MLFFKGGKCYENACKNFHYTRVPNYLKLSFFFHGNKNKILGVPIEF